MKKTTLVKANGFLFLIFTLLFASFGSASYALDFDAEWQAATEAYADHNYATAQIIYERLMEMIPEGQVPTADLCYNLGNTYYQLDQRGMAAWMFERALQTSPRHDDARKNLKVARAGAALPETETFFLFKPLTYLYARYTAGEWALLFTVVYLFAALFGVCWTLAAKGSKFYRMTRVFCMVSLVAMAVVASFLVPRYLEAETREYGVVVQSGQFVRSAPGDDEERYFEALEGERIEISEAPVAGWYRIKRPGSGVVGYLPEKALKEI